MVLEKFKLTDKVAIVTGGTSGIGRSIALGLAEAGAHVVPVSRTPEKVKSVVNEIKSLGVRTLDAPTDVTRPEEVSCLKNAVLGEFGRIDILVNNAGTTVKKLFTEQSREDWNKIIDLNLNAVFICCQVIGSHMVAKRQGKIINIASVGSRFAITGSLPYCVSKGGLLQLTRTLSAEWAQYNINVNAIAPAYFKTPMTKGILKNKELYERIINRIPMGRLGDVEELKGIAVFLASEASSYITGAIIYVDGGFAAYGV
ncbi:MAG: SDR family oxidoreductase [Firmicutes bacterium]|nr:SDR family oxidoreductase [Bacillota bacterium]